jgi:PHD/YefM family antitoxin component YafN of YafNO toxin-antitoxin module
MAALIQRSDQLVNLTDLARRGSDLFGQVASSKQDRLVVLRKSQPIAVVLNVNTFESMLDEVEELRTELMGLRRIDSAANDRVSHEDLQQSLGF